MTDVPEDKKLVHRLVAPRLEIYSGTDAETLVGEVLLHLQARVGDSTNDDDLVSYVFGISPDHADALAALLPKYAAEARQIGRPEV